MTLTLTELLKDYRHNIERALAGAITGKADNELSDEDIESAKQASKKITNLVDYKNLADSLDGEEAELSTEEIFSKYGIKHMSESDYADRDIMMREGFKFYGVFEDEKLRGQVTSYLDENEIDYMDDGTGHVQMRFADRDSAYRVEEHVARMLRQSNPRFMRDHIEVDERAPNRNKDGSMVDPESESSDAMNFADWRKANPQVKNHSKAKRAYNSWKGTQKISEEGLEENSPFERKTDFPGKDIKELQRMADKMSNDGAPEEGKQRIHKRIAQLRNEKGVEEGKKKKKTPSKPRDPAHAINLAKRQSGAAGAHSSAKYNKGDRRQAKDNLKRGDHDD